NLQVAEASVAMHDPAEFRDARNRLELLDRLFPRKTTVGAPNLPQLFVESFPRWRRRSSKPRHDVQVLPMHTSSKKEKAMAYRIAISFAGRCYGHRGLISARAPDHEFLGAVGAFAMDSYAARAWGGQPIAARKSRFSAGPRLPEPHERSCSRGFLTR